MSATKRPRKGPHNRRRRSRGGDNLRWSGSGVDLKMSAVLLAFIEPYRELAESHNALEKLVVLGIIGWNASLMPEHERDHMITKLLSEVVAGKSAIRRLVSRIRALVFGKARAVADFEAVVHELVERKLQHFGEVQRFVVNYELAPRGDDVHLVVVSTLMPVG